MSEGRALVTLHGPRWSTGGEVSARVSLDEDGARWLAFPLKMGVGDVEAVLRVDGGAARLPLGGRPGEFDVDLVCSEGPADATALESAGRASADALRAERLAWAQGVFLLRSGARTAGEVRLRGELPPQIAVYDTFWLSDGLVSAERQDDGGDLVLRFAARPALMSEDAVLRINVASGVAVVPTAQHPSRNDRRLDLVPGELNETERAAAVAAAITAADAAEREWVAEMAPRLAQEAYADGVCRQMRSLDPTWALLFAGYDVNVSRSGGGCVVDLEPTVVQHRRRFRGTLAE